MNFDVITKDLKIIDIHTHAFPDRIAEKAIQSLESLYTLKLLGDGTLKSLLRYMDDANVSISFLQMVATKPEQVPSANDWLIQVKSQSNRFNGFGALHPNYPDYKKEIKKLADNDIHGIKFQTEFQFFYPDDEAMFKIYREIGNNFFVMFHAGYEITSPTNPKASPERLAKLHDKFPKLKIIAAHFGGFLMQDDVDKYIIGTDIYIDTSLAFSHLSNEEIVRKINQHGYKKVFFGTDFPMKDPKIEIENLLKLNLSDSVKRDILSNNAIREFSL